MGWRLLGLEPAIISSVIDVPNEVRPGEDTSWKLTVKDAAGRPVQGQAALTVYDKSLDYYAKPEHALSAQALFPQNAQTADRTSNQEKRSIPLPRRRDYPPVTCKWRHARTVCSGFRAPTT